MYRAVDKAGNTVDFLLRAHRDKATARRYFEKAIDRSGTPETVTMDRSGANLAALQASTEEPIPAYKDFAFITRWFGSFVHRFVRRQRVERTG